MSVARKVTQARREGRAGSERTCTAVVFSAANTLAAHPVQLPVLGPSDMLLRTHLTGIFPESEGPLLAGEMRHLPGMAFPLVPGQGAVCEVVATGSAVSGEWQGARVFAGAGHAPNGLVAAWGTQATGIVAPVDAVVRLPDLPAHAGVLLTEIGMALHALDLATLAPGCRVLVLGQGPRGQIVARLARLRGTEHITVADASVRRLQHARADHVILLPARSQARAADALAALGDDVDLLIDTTGDTDRVSDWLPALRRYGTLLLLAYYPRLELTAIQKSRNGIRIVLSADWSTDDLTAAYDMVAHGQIDLTGLISHTFPISRVGQAYVIALGDPDAMQVVLTWE